MNFRIQDLTKILIPGIIFLFLSALLVANKEQYISISTLIKDTLAIWIIIFFTIVYICGFFLDFIGSVSEAMFYNFYPRPSFLLLTENDGKIQLSQKKHIIEFLFKIMAKKPSNTLTRELTREMFIFANACKEQSSDSAKGKLYEYYFLKIFSRNLSISFLLSFLIYICSFCLNFSSWTFNTLSIFLIVGFILAAYRWRTLAFYYSRQVFYAASEELFKCQK